MMSDVLSHQAKVNLLDYDLAKLALFCETLGEKPYRAAQLLQWIHFYGKTTFHEMSNLSKKFREQLAALATMTFPTIHHQQVSRDGTRKWLFKLQDGNCIETVFIPELSRGTLCLSSQVGCALDCQFCWTGKQGFSRNLSTGEIIAQLWLAVRELSTDDGRHDRVISNVVMMGMGEPLLNLDQLLPALNIMCSPHAYSLSKYRVTVSTAGVVPAMQQLRMQQPVALAVSLHAPNDELRDQLVPLNRKYPLKQLMSVCRHYFARKKRVVTMEYVMLAEVNDHPEQARQLVKLLREVPAKVNLIPFNPFPASDYRTSPLSVIHAFRDILMQSHIRTTIRTTRGEDIEAACGQLAGLVHDRTRRQATYQAHLAANRDESLSVQI